MNLMGKVFSKGIFKIAKASNVEVDTITRGGYTTEGGVRYVEYSQLGKYHEKEKCAEGEEDVISLICLSWYIKLSTMQRVSVNMAVLLTFISVIYISYQTIDNTKTICLIGLTLYSVYFLLFAVYMLSTVLKDEYDTYSTIKRNQELEKELSSIYTNDGLPYDSISNHVNHMNHAHKKGGKNNNISTLEDGKVKGKGEIGNACYTTGVDESIESEFKNEGKGINQFSRKNIRTEIQHPNNDEKDRNISVKNIFHCGDNDMNEGLYNANNGMDNDDEPMEGFEIFSFDNVAKPIKEGSEGFFAVQYNSIFKISTGFTILLLLLYIFRGDYIRFPQEKSSLSSPPSEEKQFIVISPLMYGIITAISFLFGTICSSIAGYNGIYVAVRANVLVAKASTYSYSKALITCFRSGAISAIINVSLAMFGICSLLLLVNILYPTLVFTKYPLLIVGYGFGASLVAMLYQLAGGIYTKAADIGADLVGKIEKHIPEDDARNPAVIADLVGDNVGDCAGQCADLFESISAEIIASMILGGSLCENGIISEKNSSYFVLFPLFVHSMDLFVSTIGIFLVHTKSDNQFEVRMKQSKGKSHCAQADEIMHHTSELYKSSKHMDPNLRNTCRRGDTSLSPKYASYDDDGPDVDTSAFADVCVNDCDDEAGIVRVYNLENPLKVMLRAYFFTCVLAMAGFFFLCKILFSFKKDTEEDSSWIYLSLCGLIGMICSYLFVILTRYYTDYSYPKVKKIAEASLSGPATNIITGLYVGLESTFLPTIVISVSLLASYHLGLVSNMTGDRSMINGLYGTSVATMGMLSTAVFILSMSNFGPIADNAGGIVEMSKQPKHVRFITDKLDAVGNVTKANTKGFSVGSAALACFLLFSAFLSEVSIHAKTPFTTVDIAMPEVFIGGILGSVVVFLFAGWSLDAVGNTAEEVLKEVRRQFNEHPGILTYKEKPDYHTCVAIISKKALIETIKPGLLGLFAPIIVGFLFKQIGTLQNNKLLGAQVLASFIMFSTSTGILMALFMNNAGGAWDNAKKYIESGFYGGKNSPAHVSSVIGDTVGDPCKDTAGPSIHVLIKLISTITMVMTPLIASTAGT
ncbi:vacuolar-type H+ pumping pyrophosphatase [Plasmodium gonderi]|uniref:H(+)-exporting diphosphatase n=1 Tax=Plasmodium gonderi TaxID=77519 RepID=A0A1Y1JR67_PLAGO|nr:vacuolar-type H+ pumping pyrophosphatase [Plasmodium gonderi]GAW83727.1 vacuolar-type H+ pumping pyrophosphatase [Plasmodium gonderi]